MIHLGDFPANHTAVCIPFDSFAAATGAPAAVTGLVAGDVLIYKDGGVTQRSSSAGITVSASFDSQTGLQMIVINLSDNTDAGFYAAGHEYQVAVADVTIDAQTVRFWVATFSIERTGGALAVTKAMFTTAMTESYNADGAAPTPAQALFVIMQRLTEFSIASTTITVKKLDGSTSALTLTLNDATSPTSSTRAS